MTRAGAVHRTPGRKGPPDWIAPRHQRGILISNAVLLIRLPPEHEINPLGTPGFSEDLPSADRTSTASGNAGYA